MTRLDRRHFLVGAAATGVSAVVLDPIGFAAADPGSNQTQTLSGTIAYGAPDAEFTISASDATPGYLPGPVQAGTWQVIFGPYTVAPQGLQWTLTVTLGFGPDGVTGSPTPRNSRYVRAEVRRPQPTTSDTMAALTNPIFLGRLG